MRNPRTALTACAVATVLGLALAQPSLAQQGQGQSPTASPPSSEKPQTEAPARDQMPTQERTPMQGQTPRQEPSATQDQTRTQDSMPSQDEAGIAGRGQELIGKEILGAGEESLGEVQEVVVENGQVQAVLVDVGGFLGFGGKRVAIPADQVSVEGDHLVAPALTMQDLEQLPEHDKGS